MQGEKPSHMEVRSKSILTSEKEEEKQSYTSKARRIPNNYGGIYQKTITYWCGFRLKVHLFLNK